MIWTRALRDLLLSIVRPQHRASLSVVIITQNCADQLRVAMSSVAAVADEIVVVDGGSSDHTEEVVKTFDKSRYIQRQMPDDIGDQKNYAIERASCDWVFVLDSDEAVGPAFRDNVQRWINSRWRMHYSVPRYWVISTDPVRHLISAPFYPDFQLRLFRNTPFWRLEHTIRKGREKGWVHADFPARGSGFGKKMEHGHLFHFDLLYNDRPAREKKVERYMVMEPSSRKTHHEFYLFEDNAFEVADADELLDDEVLSQLEHLVAREETAPQQ